MGNELNGIYTDPFGHHFNSVTSNWKKNSHFMSTKLNHNNDQTVSVMSVEYFKY